jgi:hypothetical protein
MNFLVSFIKADEGSSYEIARVNSWVKVFFRGTSKKMAIAANGMSEYAFNCGIRENSLLILQCRGQSKLHRRCSAPRSNFRNL